MTELVPQGVAQPPQPVTRDKEGIPMLLHEALARSRQPEVGEAARPAEPWGELTAEDVIVVAGSGCVLVGTGAMLRGCPT